MFPDPDRREAELRRQFPADYKHIRSELYPLLRSVSFKYDLRRVGMIKDTIHTTEPDTLYARGVELMQERQYAQALYILSDYKDRNTAVVLLSLGHDDPAYEILCSLPETATTEYLKAIALARLGRWDEALDAYDRSVLLDEKMEFRAGLDPELNDLLKHR